MFSLSTCAKCDGHNFEVVEQSPAKSRYKVMFVQCSSCNAPIGVLDYLNIGASIEVQNEALEAQSAAIRKLGAAVSDIEHNLKKMMQYVARK